MTADPRLAEYEDAALLILEHCQPMTVNAIAAQLGVGRKDAYDIACRLIVRGIVSADECGELRLNEEKDQ